MRWRVWRLTALYLGSCSLLIMSTIGSDRAIGLLRRQTARIAATSRDVALPRLPIAAASDVMAHPIADQVKKRGARLREYRVPIGSVLSVQLRTPISSASSRTNDQVDATLSEAVTQDGVELIPSGSLVHGTLLEVVPGVRKSVSGQVTMAFAVVQHAVTHSRAAIRTYSLTIEAQRPEGVSDSRRRSSGEPIDVVLPAGHPLLLTLADPLVVFIPTAASAGGQSQAAMP
jgi:hypothetical protein